MEVAPKVIGNCHTLSERKTHQNIPPTQRLFSELSPCAIPTLKKKKKKILSWENVPEIRVSEDNNRTNVYALTCTYPVLTSAHHLYPDHAAIDSREELRY